jgi:hypothetical protein
MPAVFKITNNNNNNNIYLLQLGCHPMAVVSHPVAVVNSTKLKNLLTIKARNWSPVANNLLTV